MSSTWLILAFFLAISQHYIFASPIAARDSQTSVESLSHRTQIQYRSVHPSALSRYEGRIPDSNAVGDFVMRGLDSLMTMATKEYSLRQSESFYWGPDGSPVASLTAYVGDKDVRVLSMERFQDVLDHAKCSNDSVEFTFKKESSFDSVQKEWQWINDAHDNYVVLVTENAECNAPDGDRTSRQPWHIKAAAFDESKNTVTLTAEPKTWETAFSHWHLNVNSKGLLPHVPHPRQRLVKRLDIDKMFSIDLTTSSPSVPIDIANPVDNETVASVACNPCSTTGSLDFVIDITYNFPDSLTGSVTITPNNIAANVTSQLSIKDPVTSQARVTIPLFSIVPDGINLHGIANIGPTLAVDLIAGIDSANAQANLSSGVVMSIPADAKAVLDFSDPTKNQVSGWTPQFQSNTPDNQLAGEVSLTAFVGLQLRPEFDFEILGKGLSAGLALDAPTLDLTVSPMGDTAGDACGVAGADFGAGLTFGLGAELDAFAGFGSATALPNKITILSTSTSLFSTCLTVASGPPTTSPMVVPTPTSSVDALSASATVHSSLAVFPTSHASQGWISSKIPWYSSSYIPVTASLASATSSGASAGSALPYYYSAAAMSSVSRWRSSSYAVGLIPSNVAWLNSYYAS